MGKRMLKKVMIRTTLSVSVLGVVGFAQPPYAVTCQSGLPYGNDGNPSHTYNVCYPSGHATDASLPAIVYWHGGTFRSGTITSVSCPAASKAIWCWYATQGYASYLPNYTLVQDVSDGSASNILTAQSSGQISLSGYALTSSNVGNRLVIWNKQTFLPGGYTIEALTGSGTGAILDSPATTRSYATTSSFGLYDATTEYPAQVKDGFCFLDWFGNHYGQNNVPGNPNGFLTWGHSAGGYLVEMLYLMPRSILSSTNCNPGGAIGNWTIKAVTAMSAPADLLTQWEGLDGGDQSGKSQLRATLGCIPGYQDCNAIAVQASPDSYKNPAAMSNFLLISGALDTNSPPANQGRIDPVNWTILENESHALDFSPSCPFTPNCGTAGQAFAAMNAFFSQFK